MKRHFFVLLLALMVGGIYASPNIYHTLTPGYQGIFMVDSGDADFYLSVINKSYDSVGVVRNPFNYEYQNTGNPFQYFSIEYVLGKIGALLHLRIDELAIAAEFLFPALLTLLLYMFGYRLSRSRLAAFLVAGAMMLGTELVHPNGISNLFHTFLFRGEFREFLSYSRPVNPQISAIFFFAALFALYNLFCYPRSKWRIIVAGFSVGLLVYIHPYFWLFAFVVLSVMGLYALIRREYLLVIGVCIAGMVTALTMTPFLLANLSIFLHGGSSLTQAIPSHRIIVEKVILLPLFIYLVIFLGARYNKSKIGIWAAQFAQKYIFVFLLLITGVIVSNHQVITGKLFYQQHFHFFTNIPILVLFLVLLLMELFTFAPRVWRALAVAGLVAVSAWFALGVQIASYNAHSEESARYQALAPIFTYLRHNSKTSVIFSDSYLSTRQTIYTKDYSYTTGGTDATFGVPHERIIHNYFVILALRGITADESREYMYQKDNRFEIGRTIFIGTYWRDLCGWYGCFPDSVIEDLVLAYKNFLSHALLENLQKYKIDYILWDKKKDSMWRLQGLVNDVPLIETGDFRLYRVKSL